MSDPKTEALKHDPMTDVSAANFDQFARRCWMVFAVVALGTLVMVGASFAPLPNRGWVTALVLTAAAFNAFMVASYLMHLLSEKKTIFAVLAFTALFFVALMGLTIWHVFDYPTPARG